MASTERSQPLASTLDRVRPDGAAVRLLVAILLSIRAAFVYGEASRLCSRSEPRR